MNKPHNHAASMLQYAQDAQETETPWDRWEYDLGDGRWRQLDDAVRFIPAYKYRRKPKTININGFEVPEPMREKPNLGDTYYMVLGRTIVGEEEWEDEEEENDWLSWGAIHSTREAAELHAKALLSFTQTNK